MNSRRATAPLAAEMFRIEATKRSSRRRRCLSKCEMRIRMFICFACCLAPTLRATAADSSKGGPSRPPSRATSFEKTVLPTLTRYCYDCHGNGKHKGDTVLDAWRDETAAIADQKTWERVLQKVQNHEMPPE